MDNLKKEIQYCFEHLYFDHLGWFRASIFGFESWNDSPFLSFRTNVRNLKEEEEAP